MRLMWSPVTMSLTPLACRKSSSHSSTDPAYCRYIKPVARLGPPHLLSYLCFTRLSGSPGCKKSHPTASVCLKSLLTCVCLWEEARHSNTEVCSVIVLDACSPAFGVSQGQRVCGRGGFAPTALAGTTSTRGGEAVQWEAGGCKMDCQASLDFSVVLAKKRRKNRQLKAGLQQVEL